MYTHIYMYKYISIYMYMSLILLISRKTRSLEHVPSMMFD